MPPVPVRLPEPRQEPMRQQERREKIHRDRVLEAVLRPAKLRVPHPRVVDDDVQRFPPREHVVGQATHVVERRKISSKRGDIPAESRDGPRRTRELLGIASHEAQP